MMRTHKRGMRLILLLLIASMLVGICPGMAETVSDPADVATEAPALPGNPYRIVLIAPGGWTNNNGAEIKATVTDKESIGWQKIEYRMNGGAWTDCENLFDQGKAEITVHENGTFMLRVTDPYDRTFDETAQVSTIDLAAPLVSANIANSVLHIEVRDELSGIAGVQINSMLVRDELSGIAGVQINSMLFTTVEGNKLDVELDDNMNKFEKLAVRAFDFAGNFSDPITLDNPDYVKPVDPTPEPTATPKPSKKPGSGASATDAPASAEPEPDPTPTACHGEAARSGQLSDLCFRRGLDGAYAGSDCSAHGRADRGSDTRAHHPDRVHHHRPGHAVSGGWQFPYAGCAVQCGYQQAVHHPSVQGRQHLLPRH